MTVRDVKEAVLGYGFSRDLSDNDSLFYTSLNMAIRTVNRLRPRTGSCVIVHEPVRALVSYREVEHGGAGRSLEYREKAFSASVEVTGTGGLRVTGGTINGSETAAWSLEHGWIRLSVEGDDTGMIVLSFTGDYPFAVRNISFFDTAFPPKTEIFGGDVVDYDLSKLVNDFGRVSLPLYKDGVSTTPSDPRTRIVNERVLRVPVDDRGTYEVVYEREPPRFGWDDDEKDVWLDGDLAEILPLLVASYVWRDDEPEKSETYYRLYRAEAETIHKAPVINHYIDRGGWS